MKKYLGIVKKEVNNMVGLQVVFLSKTYDDIETMNEWFNMYPNCEHVILPNTSELDSMFEIVKDFTPVTDEEIKEEARVRALYNRAFYHKYILND